MSTFCGVFCFFFFPLPLNCFIRVNKGQYLDFSIRFYNSFASSKNKFCFYSDFALWCARWAVCTWSVLYIPAQFLRCSYFYRFSICAHDSVKCTPITELIGYFYTYNLSKATIAKARAHNRTLGLERRNIIRTRRAHRAQCHAESTIRICK